MSFSWTYLTRRFWMMNYRDTAAISMISTYGISKALTFIAQRDDNDWCNQRVYTHDESDIQYRSIENKTDGAVKREHAIRYAAKIRQLRADKEREMALDAYNYLNGKNLTLD